MALAESQIRAAQYQAPSAFLNDEPILDFDEIYRAFAPEVERFIRRYVGDRARAEDLAQETFLRAFRAWPAVDIGRPVWPWLRTIAQRICVDEWRAGVVRNQNPSTAEPPTDVLPAVDTDPCEALLDRMRCDGVQETLRSLEPRQRRILLLRDAHGLRYQEIANLEGTTLAALRCSLARARQMFRKKYLAVARERGLNSLLWPYFGPVVRRMRSLRHRGHRFIDSTLQRANASVGAVEALATATPVQVSSGVLAIVIIIGSVSPLGTQAEAEDVSEAAIPAAPAVYRQSEESGAVVASVDASKSGSVEAEDAGGPGPIDGVGDKGSLSESPLPPADDIDPPVDGNRFTNPNENVSQPEDAQMSSFASSSDGSTVFAAGRNRECAARPECPAVMFRSADGGASWTRLNAEGFDGRDILLPPAYGSGDDRIFAMTYTGVLQVSTDGGQSFGPAVVGAPSIDGSMTISPAFNSGDPRILIGGQSSLFEYIDKTKTLGPAPYSSLPGSLEPAFAAPDLLMVGGRALNEQGDWSSTVFRCDGSVCVGSKLSYDHATPKVRLTPSFAEKGEMYAFTGRSLFRSTDGGATFARLTTPWADSSLVDLATARDGQLFAAAWKPRPDGLEGLYVSANSGSTWTKVANSLFDGGPTVVRLAGSRLFIGLAQGGVACSVDFGTTWEQRC